MATGDSLSGDRVTIWFAPKDTIGSDLATEGVEYQSFIQSFDEEGGDKERENVYTFSDTGKHGTVTRKKPETQKELSFDIVMRHDAKLGDFKKISNGDDVVGSTNSEPVGMIAIQQTDNDGNFYYEAFNNVDAVNFNTEFQADEEWRGSLSFVLAPTTPEGVTNQQSGTSDISSDLTAWS